MAVYYNEIDPGAAQWLRNLIAARLLPYGHVDERSIADVQPGDVFGFTQCHFFAGIGGWPVALNLAGWPESRPIWTGSCPCQPFSVVGKRKGTKDPRHLWPEFYRLICACQPDVVMGEQVSGKAGYAWLDGVRDDLKAKAYSCGAVDIPACSAGAPHIRNRLYWLAESDNPVRGAGESGRDEHYRGKAGRLEGDSHSEVSGGVAGWMGESLFSGPQGHAGDEPDWRQSGRVAPEQVGSVATTGLHDPWGEFEVIGPDPKGKYRRIKPGIALLAAGVQSRVVKLRGFGNAICPPLAAQVVRAYLETLECRD